MNSFKTGYWQRFFDLFFGYDYFIAHRSVDGKAYATALYGALTGKGNELDCFLDIKQYGAGGSLPWMQDRALKKTTRLIVLVTPHAHDADARYLRGEISQFKKHHANGIIVTIGSRQTLSRAFYPKSTFLPTIPNLDEEDICILEDEDALLTGKVSSTTCAKLLNDFSEQRQSARRLKWIRGVALAMFLLALAAGGLGLRAREAQKSAEEALIRSFVRTIGVSNDHRAPRGELEALWDLVELDPTNEAVRERVIEHWLESENALQAGIQRRGQAFHAAIGLNPRLQRLFTSKIRNLAERVLKTTFEDPQRADFGHLPTLASALAVLAPHMEPKEAAFIAGHLAERLKDKRETQPDRLKSLARALTALAQRLEAKEVTIFAEDLVVRLEDWGEHESSRLESIAVALNALVSRMEADEATLIADRLVKLLERRSEAGYFRLQTLVKTFAALAPRVKIKAAATLGKRLLSRLEDPRETDSRRGSKLAEALGALAPRVEGKEAAAIAERLLKRLEEPQETDARRVSDLAMALGAFTARMEEMKAAAIAARGGQPLLRRLEDSRETDTYDLSNLASALLQLARQSEAKEAATFALRGAQPLLGRLEDRRETENTALSPLVEMIAALALHMEVSEVRSIAERLLNDLEDAKETDNARLSCQARTLAKLAPLIEPQIIAERLIQRLEDPQRADSSRLSAFADVLVALEPRMEAKERAGFAERLLKRLEDPQVTDIALLHSLATVVAKLAPHAEAANIADRLLKRLEDPRDSDYYRRPGLAKALAIVAPQVGSESAGILAERLVKRLDDPQETRHEVRVWLAEGLVVLARPSPQLDKLRLAAGTPVSPDARQLHLVALSHLLLKEVSSPPGEGEDEPTDRKELATSYAMLSKEELAGVMKWPFCVGEAQKLALDAMEDKVKETGQKFDRDLWKFVQLAPSLGIEDLEAPAKRPSTEKAGRIGL
jgi:hypothetical protein